MPSDARRALREENLPARTNAVDRIQAEGRKFLATIEAEIRERATELDGLRANAAKWLVALNGGAPKKRGPGRPKGSVSTKPAQAVGRAPAPKPKRSSPTVDWDAILAKLPKSFTSDDLAKATPALKAHAQARNVALARWSRAGAIKKSAPGKYSRVGRG
jgi:hypothetical protein